MKRLWKWMALSAVCGSTLLEAGCATALRDAVQGGALDFVSTSVVAALQTFFGVASGA
jgi:hypothetical protein